jgi:alpha-glucosidase
MWMMIKDDQYRDNPPNPDWLPGAPSHDRLLPLYTSDRPEVHEMVAGLRAVLDEFDDRVLIGEIYLPVDRLVAYYGADLRGAQLPFNFRLLLLEDWSAASLARTINTYMAALPPGGWPSWVLGNHDRSRVAARVGPAQARIAAMLLLTLRGSPTIYMGDELGMLDTPIPPGQVQDPAEIREPGRGLGRDPERTPFPWHAGPGAGFTEGTPWLPIGSDTSLQTQREGHSSMVSLYRRLIQLRRTLPALSLGSMTQAVAEGSVLSYQRGESADALLIRLNTIDAASQPVPIAGRVLASTDPARESTVVKEYLILGPNEGVIVAGDNAGRHLAEARSS